MKAIKTKIINIARSINRSNMIVPNNLSNGMFSACCRLVHLEISPALGIRIFVRYPIETVCIQFFFYSLYPKDSIRNLHLNPRLTMAKAPHNIEIKINL